MGCCMSSSSPDGSLNPGDVNIETLKNGKLMLCTLDFHFMETGLEQLGRVQLEAIGIKIIERHSYLPLCCGQTVQQRSDV